MGAAAWGAAAPWLDWLQAGAVGKTMRQSALLYPSVEIVHILGLALLVGAIVSLDLRLLGLHRVLPAAATARHLLPVAAGGFILTVPSGALLFTTEAVALAANPAFLVKLALIGVAGLNAVVLHLGAWRRMAEWDAGPPPAPVRIAAGLSMALWIAVLACGRLIAYL